MQYINTTKGKQMGRKAEIKEWVTRKNETKNCEFLIIVDSSVGTFGTDCTF